MAKKQTIEQMRAEAKKLLEMAKREEEKSFTELGKHVADLLKSGGYIDASVLKTKAQELGLFEVQS